MIFLSFGNERKVVHLISETIFRIYFCFCEMDALFGIAIAQRFYCAHLKARAPSNCGYVAHSKLLVNHKNCLILFSTAKCTRIL